MYNYYQLKQCVETNLACSKEVPAYAGMTVVALTEQYYVFTGMT